MSWLGAHRIDLDECGSTNDEAARLARAGARHGTVVVATSQRAGRGRDGRPWQSPPGLGVYLSAVIKAPMTTALALVDVPPMTLAIGIGLVDAIRATGVDARLKWPNDALVKGMKIAGVLVEAQSQGGKLDAIIVGIGVNISRHGEPLPPAIAGLATTLEDAAGEPIDREAFIAGLLANVERWIDRYVAMGLEEIIPAWHDRMAEGLMARATINGVLMTGEVVGLADDGALVLRDVAGTLQRVRSGDVEVIKPTSAASRAGEPAQLPC